MKIDSYFKEIQKFFITSDKDTLELAKHLASAVKITSLVSAAFASCSTVSNFFSGFKRPIIGGVSLAISATAVAFWLDFSIAADSVQWLCKQNLATRKDAVKSAAAFSRFLLQHTLIAKPLVGQVLENQLKS